MLEKFGINLHIGKMKIIKILTKEILIDKKIYLNLTNGIEYLNNSLINNVEYIRISSTDLEQCNYNKLLTDLDYNFLFNLAIGKPILIIDYSSKKIMSRALYQGVPFLECVISKVWFDKEIPEIYIGKTNVVNYFKEQFKNIDKNNLYKIKYFKKLLSCNSLNISVYCNKSHFDNKYELFKNIIKEK